MASAAACMATASMSTPGTWFCWFIQTQGVVLWLLALAASSFVVYDNCPLSLQWVNKACFIINDYYYYLLLLLSSLRHCSDRKTWEWVCSTAELNQKPVGFADASHCVYFSTGRWDQPETSGTRRLTVCTSPASCWRESFPALDQSG